jgi:hypothetical protein
MESPLRQVTSQDVSTADRPAIFWRCHIAANVEAAVMTLRGGSRAAGSARRRGSS